MALADLSACVVLCFTLPLASAAEVVQDRVELSHAPDGLVVDVYHVKGIGVARLKMPEDAWPDTLIVRLHGFLELESFTATSTTAGLDCVLVRPEGRDPVHACRIGDDSVDALEREADYFEVRLPREIFPSGNDAMEIRWVDQWR
jgi:hypothetical protein